METMKRPVRIAGCSGSASDRRSALLRLASDHADDPLDVITGDWLSEANMSSRGASKSGSEGLPAYEPTFLESLEPALPHLAHNKIRLAVNAGASDTKKLYDVVSAMVKEKGLKLKVAWVSGDEVMPQVRKAMASKSSSFENIYTGEELSEWSFRPMYAQAYLGGLGIAHCLAQGADIVICGRVSDASPIIGAAIWWHGWQRDQLGQLANALVAGHLIECSSYVCGGNFSGFKSMDSSHEWADIGYPVAEIADDGSVVITKSQGSDGLVSVDTCTAQFLYELSGPWYFNSDVTAVLTDVSFEQLTSNRVALRGVGYSPPPPTTKVGITAAGGFQAEVHWYMVGLDVQSKAAMLEAQIRRLLAPNRFTLLTFTLNGTAAENPTNQSSATVDFRVFAQARTADDLAPARFARPCIDNIMCTYPGATPHLDLRMAFPKPIYEYYVTLMPQSSVSHIAHTPWTSPAATVISPPDLSKTRTYPARQPSEAATLKAVPLTPKAKGGVTDAAGGWAELAAAPGRSVLRETFGPWGRTVRGPLGWIVHARSGDKGSDANVGLWVRRGDEWDWLRSLLSTAKIKELLAEEYRGHPMHATGASDRSQTDKWPEAQWVERFEFQKLRAVHFLLRGHLDRGVGCTSSLDFLGKNVAEFLRARHVDLPTKFLDRGRL